MHIIITGHLGYIGPVLVRICKEAGHRVTGIDIGYFRECIPPGTEVPPPDDEILRDVRAITAGDLTGAEAIIHLAGLSNDPLGQLDPELTYDINTEATVRLAILAKQMGVSRFVFASSCSIYGAAGEAILDETAPQSPISAYAISKCSTELRLSKLADDKFTPVYMRNATAYGVSPRLRFDLVLNNLMAWAKATGVVKVTSDGTPWRPLVHIEDISVAALAAAMAPVHWVHNEPFNIGRSDANYRVKDIADAVAKATPGSRIHITGESGRDPRSYRVDFTKALTRLPGFKPTWTMEDGCEELNRWFAAGHLDALGFDSRTFIRLKQLQHLIETRQVDKKLYRRAS